MEATDRDTQGAQVGRWVLVLVIPVVAWWSVLFLGLLSVGVLDSLCPPEQVESGSCTADWYEPTFKALMVGWTGVSAFVVVISAAWLAPSHRMAVGAIAFVCGAAIAASMLIGAPDLHAEFAAAIGCGALALLLASWKLRAPSPGVQNGDEE